MAGGRTLAEVRAAAGHANLVTTSIYLHVTAENAWILLGANTVEESVLESLCNG